MFYVAIPRINGRQDMLDLAQKLNSHGYGDNVEYNVGGWMDKEIHTVLPHLRFDEEQDAIAFVLTYGGVVSRTLPYRDLSSIGVKIG